MRQVAITPQVSDGQADACLLLPVERDRKLFGVAPMAAVDTIDRRTTIPLESEQRADAIHDTQDTNSPAGGTDGADVMK